MRVKHLVYKYTWFQKSTLLKNVNKTGPVHSMRQRASWGWGWGETEKDRRKIKPKLSISYNKK